MELLPILAVFAFVAMASERLGYFLGRLHLPLITGFLLAGVVAGPHVLGLVSEAGVERLRFVDYVALAFIAIAAGAELRYRELRGQLASIAWVSGGIIVATYALTVPAVLAVGDAVPFLAGEGRAVRLAVALLAAAVLVARSPSSAIAIVNELRARGPFTRLMMGVTVAGDVVVIVLFAISSSVADALIAERGFHGTAVAAVLLDVFLAVFVGWLAGRAIAALLALPLAAWQHAAVLLAGGYGLYVLAGRVRELSREQTGFELFLEPLLVCMVSGFVVANFSRFRADLERSLQLAGPPVYLAFFTLAGASLELDTLARTWKIAALLVGVRTVAVLVGSWAGGALAGDPPRLNRISWMALLTQAGIGLGLAKEVAAEFPDWGGAFATTIIAVIVVNQLLGPPLCKWAVQLSGEARVKAESGAGAHARRAFVFGMESESLALARQLAEHGWRVAVATRKELPPDHAEIRGVEMVRVGDLGAEALQAAGAGNARAWVGLLSNEENLELCERAYTDFGTANVVVRVSDRAVAERCHALGAIVVDPGAAMVHLLDHFVRSPSLAGVLVGMDASQDTVEVELTNPDLSGVALRDVRLPLDVLVLSVRRGGAMLISHGYTRLELGDRLTVVGSPASLEEVEARLGA